MSVWGKNYSNYLPQTLRSKNKSWTSHGILRLFYGIIPVPIIQLPFEPYCIPEKLLQEYKPRVLHCTRPLKRVVRVGGGVKITQTTLHRPSRVKINHEPVMEFCACFVETTPGTQSVNCIVHDQCNVVALNAFLNCGAGLTGRIMMSSLWSESIL